MSYDKPPHLTVDEFRAFMKGPGCTLAPVCLGRFLLLKSEYLAAILPFLHGPLRNARTKLVGNLGSLTRYGFGDFRRNDQARRFLAIDVLQEDQVANVLLSFAEAAVHRHPVGLNDECFGTDATTLSKSLGDFAGGNGAGKIDQ